MGPFVLQSVVAPIWVAVYRSSASRQFLGGFNWNKNRRIFLNGTPLLFV
jgi:hypothetical protein